MRKFYGRQVFALLLCLAFLTVTAGGCGGKNTDKKTVITMLYSNEFEHMEQLVEDTYPDIDLKAERTSYPSEQMRRLKKDSGPDLIVTTESSSDDTQAYLADISDTSASTAYDGTIMKSLKEGGKTFLLPLPGQYMGYIVNETLFEEAGLPLPATNQELLESLLILKEQGTAGEDKTNFTIFSDYNSNVGLYMVAAMVPDFLGTVEGVQWLAAYKDKQEKLEGTWEPAFDLLNSFVEAGVMDPAAISQQHNSIRSPQRMADGTLAAVFGDSSLYSKCRSLNMKASEEGTAKPYSYRMIPLLSDDGNDPWILFAPSAYIGINNSISEEKNEKCRQILELISTAEGQDALIKDLQMGISCLKDYKSKEENVPEGVGQYVESGYIYDIFFPDRMIEYLGSSTRKALGEKVTVTEALAAADEYYYEGSSKDDYNLEIVGTIEHDMLLENYNVRTGEAEIGNFVADCVAEAAEVSIAVVNGGGIRGSFYEGEVYGEDLAAVSPFDNHIIVLKMSGKTVYDMLENGLARCTEEFPPGRFLQVSGLRYTFDSSMPAGSRLKEVSLADGKALDRDSTYKVAVNDYMAGIQGYAEDNGDGYTMLNWYDDATKKGYVSLVKETEMTYRDAMALYFEKHKDEKAGAKIEGRITDLSGQ